jgi:hypothetical protein
MNREKRETHEKVLFPEECHTIQRAIFYVYRVDLLFNPGDYPKTKIIRIANTNFRDFRAFRG